MLTTVPPFPLLDGPAPVAFVESCFLPLVLVVVVVVPVVLPLVEPPASVVRFLSCLPECEVLDAPVVPALLPVEVVELLPSVVCLCSLLPVPPLTVVFVAPLLLSCL